LHKDLVTQDELLAYAAEHPGWRGVSQVLSVVELSEPLTESPMETRLRLLLVVDGGLPRPIAQYEVRDEDGILVARFDFGYPVPRVGVEFDGRVHEQTERRVADAQRYNRLIALKWTPLRYTGRAFYRTPELIIAEVRAAISDLGPGDALGA
jgi:very-short-patch-repair endonuclease